MSLRATQWQVIAVVAMVAAAFGPSPAASAAVTVLDLPKPFQAMPMDTLLGLFSVPFESPSLAAEIARHHAWAPSVPDAEQLVPALARVAQAYPGTSDARRALLDIGGIYARKGDWAKAEALFRYVMEVAPGREGRVAYLRLVEMHQYSGAPEGVDVVAECEAAIAAYAGTPEEGLARMRHGDILALRGKYEEAFAEYQLVIDRFPGEAYTNYTRIRYALGLLTLGECDKARRLLEPVLRDDAVWAGRAYWVRAQTYADQHKLDSAIADFAKGSETADSVWVRGQCFAGLARAYAEKGQSDKARECFEVFTRFSPSPAERLDAQIGTARGLLGAGRYVEAAQYAIDVQMEVVSSVPGRYAEGDADKAESALDPIIEQCEAALSAGQREGW